MRKKALALIGCLVLMQGCSSDSASKRDNMEEEANVMAENLNEKLLKAAENKNAEEVKSLLEKGARPDEQDVQGRTPLMIAAYNHDTETAKVLIDAGANVNLQDDMENSPFLYAGAEGDLEILQLTIKAGADPTVTNRYGGTALIPASEHGYTDVVKKLLTETNVDVNHVNKLGWTALLEAVILGDGSKKQQDTIRLLIEHGSDVNLADKDGVTPIQHAKERGYQEIEGLLKEAGAIAE